MNDRLRLVRPNRVGDKRARTEAQTETVAARPWNVKWARRSMRDERDKIIEAARGHGHGERRAANNRIRVETR